MSYSREKYVYYLVCCGEVTMTWNAKTQKSLMLKKHFTVYENNNHGLPKGQNNDDRNTSRGESFHQIFCAVFIIVRLKMKPYIWIACLNHTTLLGVSSCCEEIERIVERLRKSFLVRKKSTRNVCSMCASFSKTVIRRIVFSFAKIYNSIHKP